MLKALTIAALYAFAFAFLYAGVDMAPAHGWPVTPTHMNGCALLILGMIAKTAAHVTMLRAAR